MSRQILRPRWTGDDSRSSAWFGLAKLFMPNEYMQVEAIRRSRRDRARAKLLTEADAEAVAASTSGAGGGATETESTKGEVIENEEARAEDADDGAGDAEDDTPTDSAGIKQGTEGSDAEDRGSNGNHESNNPVISPAPSETPSDRASNARSQAGSDQAKSGCQAQETSHSPRPSKGGSSGSARTKKGQNAAISQPSVEVDRESQKPPSRRTSANSSARSKHTRIIAVQQNTENGRQGSRQFSSPRPSAVRSKTTGSDTAVSGHHDTNSIQQRNGRHCSSRPSRVPLYSSAVAEWCVSIGNPHQRDETASAQSLRSDFSALPASSSHSNSSRLSQTTALTSISRRPRVLPSSPTPSRNHQGSPLAQPSNRVSAQLDSPAALRLQTWNWPESQPHAPDNQAKHRYTQSTPQAIAAFSMQGQPQPFSPASNLCPGTGVEYPPRPASDGGLWNMHTHWNYASQPQLSLPYPYPYQYPCSRPSVPNHSGGYGSLVLYSNNHHPSPMATSNLYPQQPANLSPHWEMARMLQSSIQYPCLY